MKRLPIVGALCASIAILGPATAQLSTTGAGGIVAGCKFNGTLDGCASSPGGSFSAASFFSATAGAPSAYARQSGQSYVTRPPWNVPGVDYAVGVPPATVLKDPATSALPAGCSYSATGNAKLYPQVTCTFWGRITPVAVVLDSFDFEAQNGHGPVCLVFANLPTGSSIAVTRSKFVGDATANAVVAKCNGGTTSAPVFVFVNGRGVAVSFDFENNDVNGGAPAIGAEMNVVNAQITGPITLKYNSIRNTGGKPFAFGGATGPTLEPGDVTVSYNFFGAWDNYANGDHAETLQINAAASGETGPVTLNNFIYSYNLLMQSAFGVGGGNATASIYPDLGPHATANGGSMINNVMLDHNVVISNLHGGAGGSSNGAYTLAQISYGAYGKVAITNNYTDETGASYGWAACAYGPYVNGKNLGPATPLTTNMAIFGNIDLTTGAPPALWPGWHDYWNGTAFDQAPTECSVQ